jgi:hypothetical protein
LLVLFEKGVDCVGQPGWIDYFPKDIERMQTGRGIGVCRWNGAMGGKEFLS